MTALEPQIAERADDAFVAHVTWALERTAGMWSRRTEGLVIADSGLPCDTFNFVCRARLDADEAPAVVDEAVTYFRERRRPFSWWVGPADRPTGLGNLLERAGLERAETELAMALPLSALASGIPAVPGFEARRVGNEETLRAFAELSAANWTPPDKDVVTFYRRTAHAMLEPECPQWLYVGYLNGKPVATAEATVAKGTVGLFNISTLPECRRHGIGSVMTWTPLRDARDAGCDLGVLQAAPDGVGLYRRLGFAAFGDITEYKPRATEPAEERT